MLTQPTRNWPCIITLTSDGTVVVTNEGRNADPLIVRPGDTVEWTSVQGSHCGHFLDPVPGDIQGWFAETGTASRKLTLDKDAIPGTYKYSIVLFTGQVTHLVDPVLRVAPVPKETGGVGPGVK